MILSERHRFIFVKGQKVGGTSIEIALATLCGPDDIITPVTPIDELERLRRGANCQNYALTRESEAGYLEQLSRALPAELPLLQPPNQIYFNHIPLGQICRQYGGRLEGFKIVCVERSPYSKVLSWLNMRLSYDRYLVGGDMVSSLHEIKGRLDRVLENGRVKAVRNINLYKWPDGSLDAHVMRYENLAGEFQQFVHSLGFSVAVPLPHAKKGLMSDTLNPLDIFTRDQIARINTIFAEEFDAFGYEML